jgi:hypothetical protein
VTPSQFVWLFPSVSLPDGFIIVGPTLIAQLIYNTPQYCWPLSIQPQISTLIKHYIYPNNMLFTAKILIQIF